HGRLRARAQRLGARPGRGRRRGRRRRRGKRRSDRLGSGPMPDPVKVSVEIARPRQQVFDYVDVLANHEAWRKNLYKDWRFEGPGRGVGAIARATPDAPTSRERVEIKVVAS